MHHCNSIKDHSKSKRKIHHRKSKCSSWHTHLDDRRNGYCTEWYVLKTLNLPLWCSNKLSIYRGKALASRQERHRNNILGLENKSKTWKKIGKGRPKATIAKLHHRVIFVWHLKELKKYPAWWECKERKKSVVKERTPHCKSVMSEHTRWRWNS